MRLVLHTKLNEDERIYYRDDGNYFMITRILDTQNYRSPTPYIEVRTIQNMSVKGFRHTQFNVYDCDNECGRIQIFYSSYVYRTPKDMRLMHKLQTEYVLDSLQRGDPF